MADEGSEWVKLDDVSDQVRGENWSLYWGEAKSDSDYFARLLREPLAVLQEEIDGVGPDWRVITQMVNHHVPYVSDAVCRVALVMPEEKTVLLIFYKHRPGT